MTSLNSQALIIARESRGKTQKEVADAIGVTVGLINKAENDAASLSDDKVERIAVFLNYPPTLFHEPGMLRHGASLCLYHSKRKTLPAKVLKKVNATMFIRNVNLRHLLNGLEMEGARTFHTMDPDEYGSPSVVAQALRAAWRVSEGPIKNLTALVESACGVVLHGSFGHRKLFGMSCWVTTDYPLFYLNADIPPAELRFTLAHEIGHLTMHTVPSSGDVEAQAQEFAAEFLMPAASIRPSLRNLRFDQLGTLKMHWRVPMKAIIYRAEQINAIDRAHAQRLYKRYSAHGLNAGEPFDIPAEDSTLPAEAYRVHRQVHGYSDDQLRDAVRLADDADFSELIGARPRARLSLV